MGRTMTLAAVGVVLALTLQMVAQEQGDKSRLVGTWTVVSGEKDGKQATAADVQGKTVRFTQDTITCMGKDNKSEMTAEYRLDTSQRPWRLEMKITEGEHKGKTAHGIVRFQDDNTMQICYAKPGEEAPRDFRTKEDQCCYTLRKGEGGNR